MLVLQLEDNQYQFQFYRQKIFIGELYELLKGILVWVFGFLVQLFFFYFINIRVFVEQRFQKFGFIFKGFFYKFIWRSFFILGFINMKFFFLLRYIRFKGKIILEVWFFYFLGVVGGSVGYRQGGVKGGLCMIGIYSRCWKQRMLEVADVGSRGGGDGYRRNMFG